MRFLLTLAAFTLAQAQKGKAPVGKAPVANATKTAPPTPIDLAKVDASTEKASILALQVQSTLDNQVDANGGNVKGTVVDLVLQSLNMNFTATCSAASKDYLTCANGYVSLDCVFQQAAASFGGVNCIPYLSQCSDQMLKYCQSKVLPSEKCKSQNACDCAQEAGCGWSRGHLMCLVNRPQVSCGDCPTMTRCGAIDCLAATRPCDCVALGGQCGWSTSEWRCESGKDTDCNECAEQSECGGPGVVMAHQDNCPAAIPSQLSPCKGILTCPYDKKCCPRCAGSKQVCATTQAECDGQTWELRTAPLVCPDCQDYYYDQYSDDAPTEPLNLTVTQITSNSAYLAWKPPATNFKVGVDGYSVAYAEDKANETDAKVKILDTITVTHTALTGLAPNMGYKISILPIVNATESVGAPGTVEFKTLAAAGKAQAKAKAAKAKGAKAAPATGKAATTTTTPPAGKAAPPTAAAKAKAGRR